MVSKQLVMSLRAFREHLVERLWQGLVSGLSYRVLCSVRSHPSCSDDGGQQPNGIKIASETGGYARRTHAI